MRAKYIGPPVLLAIGLVLLYLSSGPAHQTSAYGGYLNAFNAKYGTSGTALDTCALCHQSAGGGGPRNAYGNAFEQALDAHGSDPAAAFAAIESADSDGDGYSNIDEINARTKPGDPASHPGGPTPTPAPPVALTSVFVPAGPAIDGVVDSLWSKANAVNVPVANGANMGSTTVSVKSVYTSDRIFFLFDWADPTESLRREPWQKQDDGTWVKLSSTTTHQENVYYEDKLALAWDIDTSGFAQAGCALTCHAGEQPANSGYGNMYTPNTGEELDIWHWKAVRTNPVGQVDDQYLNSDRYDATTAPEAGRHSDPKTGGGYTTNQNADKTAPAFTSPDQPAPPYWILDSEKQPFADTYQPGDEIAGIIVSPFSGDRGDIQGKAVYQGGHWRLEIARPLVTSSEHDVQFTDLTKTYPFGIAVFDNASVNHAYQDGVVMLSFVPPPKQGDMNCDGSVDAVDVLLILRYVASLPVSQPPGCTPIGNPLN